MITLALLSLASSLAGWLMWLRERSRRIAAEKRATDSRARLILGVQHFVRSRNQLPADFFTQRALRTFAPAPEECE